jgi:hypothetical protein
MTGHVPQLTCRCCWSVDFLAPIAQQWEPAFLIEAATYVGLGSGRNWPLLLGPLRYGHMAQAQGVLTAASCRLLWHSFTVPACVRRVSVDEGRPAIAGGGRAYWYAHCSATFLCAQGATVMINEGAREPLGVAIICGRQAEDDGSLVSCNCYLVAISTLKT